MTPDEIKAARAACDAATPGPWKADDQLCLYDANDNEILSQHYYSGCRGSNDDSDYEACFGKLDDLQFTIIARTTLPKALDRIAQLEGTPTDLLPDLSEQNRHLRWLIGQLLSTLPSKRNWLDPAIEREMKEIVKGQ